MPSDQLEARPRRLSPPFVCPIRWRLFDWRTIWTGTEAGPSNPNLPFGSVLADVRHRFSPTGTRVGPARLDLAIRL